MAATLVFVPRGSEYTVEDSLSANAPTGTPTEENHGIVDDMIADFEAKIRALKHHRNGMSYVSRLPDDLLVEIWKHLAYSRSRSRKWLVVTHVCSRWREVALDTPTLWQAPLFGRKEMTTEMIRRSRNTALSFEITVRSPWTSKAASYSHSRCRTVQKEMHRVKSLSLRNIWTTLEFKSAPVLTKLSISSPYTSKEFNNFFGGSCPNLAHVTLTECNLLKYPESIRPLPRVTDLFIYTSYREGQASSRQVIASLKRFPNLRNLLLHNVFQTPDETTESDTQHGLGKLHFPELETLSLYTALEISLRFLDLIHHPPTAGISVKITEWLGCANRPSILNSLINRLDSSPRSLTVDPRPMSGHPWFIYAPEDVSRGRTGQFTIYANLVAQDSLRLLLALPILRNLHSLHFMALAIGTIEEFWRSCGNLPLLETLKLECDQPEFLKILDSPNTANDEPIIRPNFPSLRTLILHDDPDRHGDFVQDATGRHLNTNLTMAFAEECRWVAKARKKKFHGMFGYEVLAI